MANSKPLLSHIFNFNFRAKIHIFTTQLHVQELLLNPLNSDVNPLTLIQTFGSYGSSIILAGYTHQAITLIIFAVPVEISLLCSFTLNQSHSR